MSRAAGTLITTHNAAYIEPRFMPGYRGFCPTEQFDFGETYGNSTHRYFQDYRSAVLNSSADPYCQGGYFPTYYTHDPQMVISARARTQDRWLHKPKYQLSNRDFDRKVELSSFHYLGQKHRDFYKDKSGKLKDVDYFHLPVSAEEQFKKHKPFHSKHFFVSPLLENDPMDIYNPHDPKEPYMNSYSWDPTFVKDSETPANLECTNRTPYCLHFNKSLSYGFPLVAD